AVVVRAGDVALGGSGDGDRDGGDLELGGRDGGGVGRHRRRRVPLVRVRCGRVRRIDTRHVGGEGVGPNDEGAGVEAVPAGFADDGGGPGGGVVDDPVVFGEEPPEDVSDPFFG